MEIEQVVDSRYLLLINNEVKSYILGLDQAEKRRMYEKFEFLANGIWDAGVRVKKLRGVSKKVIFEARLNRGNRIIFTLGRQGRQTAIYVWGITGHDGISAAARNVLPANVPFLRFQPALVEEQDDLDIGALSDEFFSQESIEERVSEDYGPQKWLVLTDGEWQRLLRQADPDSLDIHLFLTAGQRKVLEQDPPLLLSGTAGSGKTTILVYTLLRPELIGKRRLFLTCSPFLKRFSERIYHSLVKNTDLEAAAGDKTAPAKTSAAATAVTATAPAAAPAAHPTVLNPDFLTFRELLNRLLTRSTRDREEVVDLPEFEQLFRSHPLARRYDTELVWEEIRSIIKGAKPPLSVQDYRRLYKAYLEQGLSR